MRSTTHIIDNLSTSLHSNEQSFMPISGNAESTGIANDSPIIDISHGIDASNLPEDLKSFEKASYKTDMKNFVASKKHGTKNVEKTKLFGFNKRQPIYEQEEFDMMCEASNFSTIFFEVNDSCMTSSKLDNSKVPSQSNSSEPKVRDICKSMDDLQPKGATKSNVCHKICSSTNNLKFTEAKESSGDSLHCLDSLQNISDSRNSLLKRKGICSSQEMMHLVDMMSDNISPEQVDVLAKSLIELGGGGDSLKTESEQELQDLDHVSLLERLPEIMDDKLLENIDAAIYENQIIFQNIKKNQLTIQNLKLQDQLLSKYMEDFKLIQPGDGMSIRDYENMCFTGAQENRRIKHWRNYLQDIDTKQHDNSTNQHSSFYMNTNTMSNSFTDLYINENDLAFNSLAETGAQINDKHMSTHDDGTNTDSITSPELALNSGDESMLIPQCTKINRWQPHKLLPNETNSNLIKYVCDDSNIIGENFYMNMTKGVPKTATNETTSTLVAHDQRQKNILVETINKINIVDSPIKHV